MTFTPGQLVVTPTGRIAKVVGENEDGRLDLRYQDCAPLDAPVSLQPKLLRAANEVTLVLHVGRK